MSDGVQYHFSCTLYMYVFQTVFKLT